MEPERLGPYRILATAAVDRLTVTYRAQRSSREPTVLIKTAKPGLTAVGTVARALDREAERLRELRHPALPTLVEVLSGPDAPALVLVDHGGHRLDTLLERAPRMDADAAAAIALELARAASAAHRAGIVLGELRPELVELSPEGGVYLHPRAADGGLPDDLASPAHMAPEQVVGEPADARSDVFALGCLLYRMLAGRGPFDGDEEGIGQRIRRYVPPPVRELASDTPRALERIVTRCLAKRRHDRYPDMSSVAARLTRALRRQTSLPAEHLVVRALARAGLADPLPAPLDRGAELGTGTARWLRRYGAPTGFATAALALAVLLWQNLRDAPSNVPIGPRGVVDQPAHLRVLARPWAEVYVDGKLADVTPVGFPIALLPGRHSVVFRHPNAPDEARTVELIAGQTVLLDVDMRVTLPPPPAEPRGATSTAATVAPVPESP
jgi:eukaryotic-like serine/threonine-protein kinase